MTAAALHLTVMKNEAVEALFALAGDACAQAQAVPADRIYVDGTYGRGGHSALILQRMGPKDRLIAYDKDLEAVAAAAQCGDPRLEIRHQSFADIATLPTASVQGLLMDLGVSSPQIDTPERGFSFRYDAPLDMRMNTRAGMTAAQWLAQASVQELTGVIRDYGEERFAAAIARAIVARREQGLPLERTTQLAELVAQCVKTREGAQHPATRTFQAVRIHINGELAELESALHASLRILRPGGRLAVISFHSLEDRIVKQFMAQHAREVVDRKMPFSALTPARRMPLAHLQRIKPSAEEIRCNPRARSAVLRVAERTEEGENTVAQMRSGSRS